MQSLGYKRARTYFFLLADFMPTEKESYETRFRVKTELILGVGVS